MKFAQEALGGSFRYPDEELIVRSKTVLEAMTDNTYFPDPAPSLEDFEESYNNFNNKLSAAKRRGSPQDTAEKDLARQEVSRLYKQLAFYVSQTAQGNLAMLLSSGFEVTRHPTGRAVPSVVRDIRLRDGRQSGQMRLDFEKNREALFYEYEVGIWEADELTPDWGERYRTTSSRHNVIAPLVPLKRYAVRVKAVNGRGESDWSDIMTHITR